MCDFLNAVWKVILVGGALTVASGVVGLAFAWCYDRWMRRGTREGGLGL
ncbi:MAG: hypothetical protein RJA36_3836 [Pseudomonadota bacterium]|jgi:ABC-type Fe3+ transport system permease subunit